MQDVYAEAVNDRGTRQYGGTTFGVTVDVLFREECHYYEIRQ